MTKWTTADIGDQTGRTAVITGKVVAFSGRSHDIDLQRRLWAVSEELTGMAFPV
jgi:hypothetical protein